MLPEIRLPVNLVNVPLTILFLFFLLVALLVLAARTLVVAKEDERLVIFRFGQLLAVSGAGWTIIVPFIDRVVRVKLEMIPGWQELSEDELRERAAELAMNRLQDG